MKLVLFTIQLLGEGGAPLAASPSLYEIVDLFLEKVLGRALAPGERTFVIMLRVPAVGVGVVGGGLQNVTPEYGYMTILLKQDEQTLYRHPHPISEVFSAGIPLWVERFSRACPNVTGFAIHASDDPPASGRNRAEMDDAAQGQVPSTRRDKPSFGIKPIEEPLPPLRNRSSFQVASASDAQGEPTDPAVHVYVEPSVHRFFTREHPFSLSVEEGGFLFGNVYRDEDALDRYLVTITRAVPAEHTGASLLELTFTGESFSSMRRQLRAVAVGRDSASAGRSITGDVKLVGWYHTHLFPASPSFGLSSIDLVLHFTTFRVPWQLAGLVNIEANVEPGARALRFYVRKHATMVRCPMEVLA